MRKKKKTRKIGRRGALWIMLTGLCAPLLGKKKPKEPPKAQALLAGTVYRQTGHALRGAEVVVAAEGGGRKAEWKGISDSRGEFAIRIPAGPGSYTITVKADGFAAQQKSVNVSADERVETSFLMEPK